MLRTLVSKNKLKPTTIFLPDLKISRMAFRDKENKDNKISDLVKRCYCLTCIIYKTSSDNIEEHAIVFCNLPQLAAQADVLQMNQLSLTRPVQLYNVSTPFVLPTVSPTYLIRYNEWNAAIEEMPYGS